MKYEYYKLIRKLLTYWPNLDHELVVSPATPHKRHAISRGQRRAHVRVEQSGKGVDASGARGTFGLSNFSITMRPKIHILK